MTNLNAARQIQLRELVQGFLKERLNSKTEKLGDDDPKRAELQQQFQSHNWLEDAAKRAAQIQAVTHTLKAVHPDAKGTNCHAPPTSLPTLSVVGSHCLGEDYELDVVGNAAALDVYKFLRLTHEGQSLLVLSVKQDPDLAAALSNDASQAQTWLQAFAGLLQAKGQATAHSLAKQLYWPAVWSTKTDALDDANYHLLEPLYASALAHRVYEQVQADRFGETAKDAREAKKHGAFHVHPVRFYPDMGIQQLGGTKPQNISQLNSQRRGNNLLFASVPPQWVSQPLKPLLNTESMFGRYGRRAEVKTELRALLKFLKTDPPATLSTRNRRAQHVNDLLLEFLQFTTELRELEPGWVAQPECKLKPQHAFWLDPEGAAQQAHAQNQTPPTDTLNVVSEDFALWFNHQLQSTPAGSLPVGDPEYNVWRKLCEEALKAYERGGLEEAMRWLDLQADELADTPAQNAKQEVAHA